MGAKAAGSKTFFGRARHVLEGSKRPRSRFGAKMAISQPNCNCQKAPKGPGPNLEPKLSFHSQIVIARRLQKAPGPDLEPKWPFHSQIVIARRLQKDQVQIWSQNRHFTNKL